MSESTLSSGILFSEKTYRETEASSRAGSSVVSPIIAVDRSADQVHVIVFIEREIVVEVVDDGEDLRLDADVIRDCLGREISSNEAAGGGSIIAEETIRECVLVLPVLVSAGSKSARGLRPVNFVGLSDLDLVAMLAGEPDVSAPLVDTHEKQKIVYLEIVYPREVLVRGVKMLGPVRIVLYGLVRTVGSKLWSVLPVRAMLCELSEVRRER